MTGPVTGYGAESPPHSDGDRAVALIRSYCGAPPDSARSILSQIFERFAQPWCQEITGRVLRKYSLRSSDLQDQTEETQSQVLIQVATRLNSMRRGEQEPITDLRGYIAGCVYNACFMRLRAASPERARMENRLRYVLRNDKHFALWEASGETLTGIRQWAGGSSPAAAKEPAYPSRDLPKLLKQIFESTGSPVTFGSLTSVVCAVMGIVERRPVEFNEAVAVAAREVRPEEAIASRQQLTALWREILDIPPNQRAALLLNLRDHESQGVIELIVATGTASFDELAAALSMSPSRLAEVWDELPLDDSRIASLLALTRQQVINLRKSARSRLSRRMAER